MKGIKALPRYVYVMLGMFLALSVATAVVGACYGERIREEQTHEYWTHESVSEFINIPVKDGELVQPFTAGYDKLVQFILLFDNYTAEDDVQLWTIIEDARGEVYYSWGGNVGNLGGETFCLMASVEKELDKNKEYYIRVFLEQPESDITVRAVPTTNIHASIGTLSVDGEENEAAALYLFQSYRTYFSYSLLWCMVLLATLAIFCLVIVSKEQWCIRVWTIVGALLMVLTAFLNMENFNGNLTALKTNYVYINCLLMLSLYLMLRALLPRASYYISVVLYLVIALANYYVLQFRGTVLLLSDVKSFSTAMSVAGTYEFAVPPVVYTGILSSLCLILIQMTIDIKCKAWYQRPKILKRAALAVIGAAAILIVNVVPGGRGFNFFLLNESFSKHGWYYSNLYVLQHSSMKKPGNYSDKQVAAIIENIEEPDDGQDNMIPKNLIVIMNESFSDLGMLGNLETNQDYMPFIHSLTENTTKGNLYVSTFGGNTCITEYEFLTGNTEELLPVGTIPYSSMCKDEEEGLVKTLQSDGYYAVAMHPYGAANWNRHKVYPALGFDEFLTLDDYEDAELLRSYVSDKADYQKIIDYYEQFDREESLFIFNVTMQNHGGFDINNGTIDNAITIENFESSLGDTYLSLIYESDKAFEYLLSYFSQVEEPTMIVMFGDHLPSLPNSFYEQLYGKAMEDRTNLEVSMQYVTPYVIWTNYDSEFEEVGDISANYLGRYILQCAELEMSEYDKFLLEQREEIPVIGKYGVYDDAGQYILYSDLPEDMLKDYEMLQYMRIVDRNSKFYNIFSVD
ncbi:MAG: LTA synthase family protein [Lachnospiraceae bacterium]|nr:LTA synthase family protein [Lachnospiraceae bacterium]